MMDWSRAFIYCLVLQVISISNVFAQTFSLTSSSTSITLSWTGAATPVYTDFTITVDGTVAYDGTGMGERLQMDGSEELTGLVPGNQYIIAVTGDGSVIYSNIQRTAFDTVSINPITTVTTTTINLQWSAVTGATSYTVKYFDQDTVGAVEVMHSTGTSTIYQLTNLLPGHYYLITVTATSGDVSNSDTVTQNTVPNAPMVTSVTAVDGTKLYVEWTPAADSIQDSFVVQFYPVSDSSAITVASGCGSTSCTLDASSYPPGQQILVNVAAVRGSLTSAQDIGQGNTRPSPVSTLTLADFTTTSLKISWAAVTPSSGYRVTISPDEGIQIQLPSPVKYSRTNLIPGRQYTFTVYTESGAEESLPTSDVFFTKPQSPGVPTLQTATTTSLAVTWSSPTMGDYQGYKVSITKTSDGSMPPNNEVTIGESTNVATFNDLVPGAEYTVQVRSVVDNNNVESDLSEASFYTKPNVPINLVVRSQSTTSLMVQWSEPAAEHSNEFSGFWAQLQNVDNTRKTLSKGNNPQETTFTGLQPGTQYTVEVATTTVGEAQISEIVTAQQYTKPSSPNNLREVAVTVDSLTVEWNAPDNINFESYEIILKQGATIVSSETLVIGSGLTHTFTGLSAATAYVVTLETSIMEVHSEQIHIDVNTKPNPPVNLMVTDKTTSTVSLSWTAPTQNVAVEKYVIEYGIIGKTAASVDVPGTTHILSNLGAGATYTVSAYSVNSGVQSEAVTVQVTLLPNAPTGLIQTYIGQASVQVEWQAPQNSELTGYRVWVQSGSTTAGSEEVGTSTTSTELPGLAPGVAYTVHVIALSGVEESVSTTLDINTLPTSVASMEVDETTTSSITVSWSEPVGTTLTHYELTINPNHGGATLPVVVNKGQSLMHAFSSLWPGVSYTLSIQVKTGQAVSDTVTRTVSTVPAAVHSLTATTNSGTAITITWGVDTSSTQQSFKVTYGEGGSSNTVSVSHTGQASYSQSLTSLEQGFTYTISVVAESNGQSSATQTTMQTTDPEPVMSLTATVESATTVRLSWTAGAGKQDIFQYRYQGSLVSANSAWTSMMQTTDTSVTLTNLFLGELYTFEVSAVASDRVSVVRTTMATVFPLPPTGLTVTPSETFLQLSWNIDLSATFVESWEYRYQEFGASVWTTRQVTSVTPTEVVITQLTPGQTYSIEVYSVTRGDVKSQTPASLVATTVPVCNSILTENIAETSNQQIAVDYSPNVGSVFDEYVFRINITNIPAIIKRRDDTDRTLLFTEGIRNGTYYTVAMAVRSADQSSTTKSTVIISNPYKPEVQADQSTNHIELIIIQALGGTEEYRTTCLQGGFFCGEKTQTAEPGRTTRVRYDHLSPERTYDFTVVALVGRSGTFAGKQSNIVNRAATTHESVPGPVSFFNHSMMTSTQVTLTWGLPLAPNGVITGFQVKREGLEKPEVLDANARSTTFTGLQGGITYTFSIQAATQVGYGQLVEYTIATEISAPAMVLPVDQARPSMIGGASQNSFTVKLVDPFSEDNGAITGYAVIVAKQTGLSLSNSPPGWAAARRNNFEYYQATDQCPLNNLNTCSSEARRRKRATGEEIDFTVGDDSCDENNLDVYCNGPLEENTDYYIALRAYASNGDYTDGPFSDRIHTAGSSSVGHIVGPVVAVVLVIVVVLLVIFFIRRRRKDNGDKKQQILPMNAFSSGVNSSQKDKSHLPIRVADFVAHTTNNARDAGFMYSEEFEDLKGVGLNLATSAAELPANRRKNRSDTILPFDHSRVKLKLIEDDHGSDYINANYLPGFNSKHEYIVAQGCLSSTRNDFWRMVWEDNCRFIVMLTKCAEKGRKKCDHYWPGDFEPVRYGDLRVQIQSELKRHLWMVTELSVSLGTARREVMHFRYINWPEFSVPKHPEPVVGFVQFVRSHIKSSSGPIVVHGSGGAGRCGVFVALDHVLQALGAGKDHVDIYGIVHEMRNHRTGMVQTEQQYIFIHDCVASVLKDRSEYTSLRNMDYVDKDYGAIYEDLDIEEDIYEEIDEVNEYENV